MRVLSSIKASKDAITKEYVDGNIPTKVSQLTNDSGYTTNTGTITQIKLNGTSVATSGVANIQAIPTIFGSSTINGVAGNITSMAKYGNSLTNGILIGANILNLGVNKFYRCFEKGATITCNYSDIWSGIGQNCFDGSYSGWNTNINPSTMFTEKPFILEMTRPTYYEYTDVSRLLILGHRLYGSLMAKKYKIEVAYAYSNGEFSWATVIDYDGNPVDICQKYYGLYCSSSGIDNWHPVYGIRLTISESTSTIFQIGEIQLLCGRGTEQPYEAIHCVPEQGGTFYGNITAPKFIGTSTNAEKTAGSLTIQKNGTQVGDTFNGSANKTINITTPTKTSDLTNDSGFLTSHQDISVKENISNKITSIDFLSTDTQYPSAKCVYNITQSHLVSILALQNALGLSYDTYNGALTYNSGDTVVYNHTVYECNTNGTTGTWDSSKWTIVPIIVNE